MIVCGKQFAMEHPISTARQSDHLKKIANMKMPFGKYKGIPLIDLPEPYVIWFSRQGFPRGELGQLMHTLLEIKVNGLEHLVRPLKSPNKE